MDGETNMDGEANMDGETQVPYPPIPDGMLNVT